MSFPHTFSSRIRLPIVQFMRLLPRQRPGTQTDIEAKLAVAKVRKVPGAAFLAALLALALPALTHAACQNPPCGAPAGPALAATFVDQTVPSAMLAGQSYVVTVRMRNDGNTTWTAATNFRLGSQDPVNNSIWGVGRALLTVDVAKGQTAAFTFSVVAPATAGAYKFQWQMLQESVAWFGPMTPSLTVPVSANAAPSVQLTSPVNGFIVAAPTTILLNASASDSDGSVAYVQFWYDGQLVDTDYSAPYSTTIASAAVGNHQANATAVDNRNASTASSVTNFSVMPPDSATFLSQSAPAAMVVGQPYAVSVRWTNTGSTTWVAGTYRLGSQNPASNNRWSVSRAALPANVAPGQTAAFNFTVTAPTTPGTYNFQWMMMKDDAQFFGTTSQNLSIVVGPNQSPSVQLTAPANGANGSVPVALTLAADATDADGFIARVEFWSNGVLLGSDTSAPYQWPTGNLAPGNYQFKAIAVDNLGLSGVSATASFAVTAPPPSPVSLTRTYVYDGNGRLCKVIDPESGASVFAYDLAGNVAWTVKGSSLIGGTCDRDAVPTADRTKFTYDAMNRSVFQATPGGQADVTTVYELDGLVKTISAVNADGSLVVSRYDYNKRRLLVAESSSNGPVFYPLAYEYDANAHLSLINYPDGQTIAYTPDAFGSPTWVGTAAGQVYASDIKYLPNGAIGQFVYGNGIVHKMTPNGRQLPARSQDMDGAKIILDDSYVFDRNGNVNYVDDATPHNEKNRTRALGYDDLDRLIVADAPYQWQQASYSYDALDNLRAADVGPRKYRYSYNSTNNRLDGISSPSGVPIIAFAYDTRGNTTAKNSQAYVFDIANRLSKVTGLQSYRYDGQGRRAQATDSDGKTTFWIYSKSGQVMYTSEARRSRNLSYIYLGNTQVATRAVAWGTGVTNISYQHTDALGSPVAETNSLKEVVKRNSYEPYGSVYGDTNIDGTGYTGHVMDRDTGLTYMQQRYYDPAIGRFLSDDPVATNPNTGASFNRYWYANNNPFKFVDPDGRESGCVSDRASNCGVNPSNVAGNLAALADLLETIDQNSYAFPVGGTIEHSVATPAIASLRTVSKELLIARNAAQGAKAELKVARELVAEGKTIIGSHVSVRTSEGRRVIDHLVTDAAGKISAVEVKSGAATRNAAQLAKDAAMATEGGTIVGKNAPAALRGTTLIIETEVRRAK
jgi:RHS repeat-associated protein